MRRGRATTLLLALLCLLSGGCATLNGTGSRQPSVPNPGTAIALSVLSESVYLVDPATGRQAEVAGGLRDFQSGYATWAPDHQRLAYANHAIYLLDFDTNEQRVVVRGRNLSMPAWNPEGDEIVYGNGVSMWRTPMPAAASVLLRMPAMLAPLDMDWGRNGLIAFEGLVRGCYRCPSTDRSDIWVFDPNGGPLRQVTHVGHAESPKWSPDGSRILFIRRPRPTAAQRELWVVNADGSGARKLGTARNVVAADWSPDGFRIAMVRAANATHTLQLWISDLDGSNARALGQPIKGTEATVDW
jgi:Tol biopolymer transport system component